MLIFSQTFSHEFSHGLTENLKIREFTMKIVSYFHSSFSSSLNQAAGGSMQVPF